VLHSLGFCSWGYVDDNPILLRVTLAKLFGCAKNPGSEDIMRGARIFRGYIAKMSDLYEGNERDSRLLIT
jgi:hypothetical protein